MYNLQYNLMSSIDVNEIVLEIAKEMALEIFVWILSFASNVLIYFIRSSIEFHCPKLGVDETFRFEIFYISFIIH